MLAALCALLVPASAAAAHAGSGGGAAYEEPGVTALKCGTGDAKSCPRGNVLRLSGEGLARTRQVLFLGGKGTRDDRAARPTESSPHRVIVTVPTQARSGPIRVIAATGGFTGPSLKVLPKRSPVRAVTAPLSVTAASLNGGVFPVQGRHEYGDYVNTFGGGRGHQGQDVFAKCGTPLVAALAGEVTLVKFQERAGNYIVIKAADGTGQAYMHLLEPSPLKKGDPVAAGQPIGKVGQTGRATGCHLHFELWTAPGWYEGGSAIDPLPTLRSWDTSLPAAESAKAARAASASRA